MSKGPIALNELFIDAEFNNLVTEVCIDYKYGEGFQQTIHDNTIYIDLSSNIHKLKIIEKDDTIFHSNEFSAKWQKLSYNKKMKTLTVKGMDTREERNTPYKISFSLKKHS